MAANLQPRLHLVPGLNTDVDSRNRSQDVSPVSPLPASADEEPKALDSANPSDRSVRSAATSASSSSDKKKNKKKHGSMLSFFTLKEPSSRAFDKLAAQHKEHQALTAARSPSLVGVFGVSSQKIPSNVPKTNTKWDGLPQASRTSRSSQEKPRVSHERKDSLWSAIKRRPSNAASRSSFGSLKTSSTQDTSSRPSTIVLSDDKSSHPSLIPGRTVSPVLESDSLPVIEHLTSLTDDLILPSPVVSSLEQSIVSDSGKTHTREQTSGQLLIRTKPDVNEQQEIHAPTRQAPGVPSQQPSANNTETVRTQLYDDSSDDDDDELYSKPESSNKPQDSPMQATNNDFQSRQSGSVYNPIGDKILQALSAAAAAAMPAQITTNPNGPTGVHPGETHSSRTSSDQDSPRRPSLERARQDSDATTTLAHVRPGHLRASSQSRSPSISTVFIAPARVSEQYTRSLHSSHSPSNSHSRPRSRSMTPPARSLADAPVFSTAAAHSRQVSNSTVASNAFSLLPGESSPKLMQASTIQVQPAPETRVEYVPPNRYSRVTPRQENRQLPPLQSPQDTIRPTRARNFSKPFNSSPSSPDHTAVTTPLSAASDSFPAIQPLCPRRPSDRRLSSADPQPNLDDDDAAKNYALSVGFWETATAAATNGPSRGRMLSDPGPIPVPDTTEAIPFSSRLEGPFDPASALF